MSQVPSSNISLSYLSYLLYNSNINKPISFSSLYKFSADSIQPHNPLNLSYFSSKYRNFLPSDIDSLLGWYDIKTSNSYTTIYNNASNIFNLITNIKPLYNKYGLNTKQSIFINNNNYYIDNINLITSNFTIGLVYNTSNVNKTINVLFNFTTLDSIYNNPPSGTITYTNIPFGVGDLIISDGTTKINGYIIPKGYQIWKIPRTGIYSFVAGGAKGDSYGPGQGGYGVVIKSTVNLIIGQYVIIAIGKSISQGLCGGGGGTFITIYAATGNFNLASQHTILLIAGGGGGSGSIWGIYANGVNANITKSGGNSIYNNPGLAVATNGGGGGAWYVNGGDGTDGVSIGGYYISGGGGFIGNGGGYYGGGPKSFLNGCYGSYYGGYYGGFGGGGNGYYPSYGGGGGGYSGGNSGIPGGGGGSYDINGINNNAILYTTWETSIFGIPPISYINGYNNGDGFIYVNFINSISCDIFYGNEFSHLNSNISINSNIYTSNLNNTGFLISTLSIKSNNTLNIKTRYNCIDNSYYNASGIKYITLNNSNILFKNFQGNVSEILLYNSLLSNSNIYLLESYFATKWWGNPSYLLKSDHMYYNINTPSLINFPQLLYLFDTSTEISTNNLLINRGNQGSLLNATINNNYLNYSLIYSSNYNSLLIYYNFDNNNDNLGNLGSSYNFSINTGNPYYDNITKVFGIYSICLNNSSLLIPISYDQNIFDFSLNTEYTISFWYYINTYNILDSLFGINNDHNFILARYLNTSDLIFANIIIKNAGIIDNKWKNITITMKKINNNCYINIYYNSYLLISNYLLTNTWILTNNNYNYIILNKGNTNIYYDNFRIYNRVLSTQEIQEILNLSISTQKSYNNNNYGYLIKNNYINLDYNNFKYIFYNNNQITISFNLLIYNNDYIYTDIFYAYNILKISFKNNYLDINYNNIRKTYTFINDFKSHNYKIITNGIQLYIDNILNSEIIVYDDILNYITNDISNIVAIGNYNNNQNFSPFLIENLQIYNYENYSNINFSDYPKYNYKIPFNYISFTKGFNKNIHLGPTYNDDILIPYNSSNLTWINDKNIFDVFNGIQKFTILADGYYDIIASGAGGGYSVSSKKSNGKGIILNTISYLYKNDILYIAVGQKGGNGISGIYKTNFKLSGEGGGGGCSVIYNYTSNNIILIAGGGGGNSDTFIGKDATNITSGTTDTNNKGIVATNGNGGNSGNGAGGGYGVGGGGFYKNAQYVANYSGLSFISIMNNSNIIISNDSNSIGGYGGFPCGANGGTNYNTITGVTNWIWGGGGGGGYSGGIGGSLAPNGLTYGGGGGGSYDINSVNNYGNIINYGKNGYNESDGYVNIKYITNDPYYIYANANSKIIYNGLILLIEPHNIYCFDEIKPLTLINLINANSCYVNKSIKLTNNYINFVSNNLVIPNNNILSITIFYKIIISNNGTVFDDIKSINKCYINNNNNGNITTINNVSSIMNCITLIGSFNANTLTLFNNITSINIGCILCYNRIIDFNEHINNFNCYINKY